jgi:glycosyltransferase involved in cell wall biosynthesis
VKIALDIRTVTSRRSGVGNYVRNLLAGLERTHPAHAYLLLACRENLAALDGVMSGAATHQTRLGQESHPLGDLWEHLWLPGALKRRGVDLLHGPMLMLPLGRASFARVVTIHDLVPMLFPETVPRKYALYVRWLLPRVAGVAERVICVSGHTKDDLVRELGMDPERVVVVHEAPQPGFRPLEDLAALARVRERHGITKPFFFHLGNIEPRKNLVGLVKAFLSLSPRGRAQLVLGGHKGWLTQGIFKELDGLDLSQDVIFTGYLPQEDLPLLMNAAAAFVFPSLYEGFGLPVLEAMACGTPVITSNISSLPEVAGDAALLVDPRRVEDLAGAMERVLEDGTLRRDLSRAGLERAAQFTWERAARETMAVYEQAMADKGLA